MSYQFSYTDSIINYLQSIERSRQTVQLIILPHAIAEKLRNHAIIRSTHHSTQIEGNLLTLKETEQVIQGGKMFPGRERDVKEITRYYTALQQVENWGQKNIKITDSRIQMLHAILYSGKKKPTVYRDGQNVIRGAHGKIAYMPPEAKDVPVLMSELVKWIQQSYSKKLPIPLISGIAHYQFETIHPFYDGNGRTGRLLTTWILNQSGYDLGKFYALEEFYSNDLSNYYDALITHPHHNYYFGRHAADVTSWLEYFLNGMHLVFEQVAQDVKRNINSQSFNEENIQLTKALDHRARRVFNLFLRQDIIRSSDVANLLGLSVRQARELLSGWVIQGWINVLDPSNRGRKYSLSKEYQKLLSVK